ncbi:MAG TPA: flagella basal body P-ring formation protein FlgA [Allosphingosinicella sp.]|nr:flagella basal body P-ring formation protein FlgA [Allosphingosinicella sp.]
MVPIFRRFALPAAALALPLPSLAQGFENLDMLDNRVAAALGAHAGEPGGATTPIDRRLRLQACPQPVEIGEPIAGAIAVRCVPLGWRIRVSLMPSAETRQTAVAATPSQPQARPEPVVRRGDQIELVAMTSSFSVSTIAVAEQDGAPGDRIRVRTERRAAPVIGQVLADGRVALPGFN